MRRQHVDVQVHSSADAATLYGLLRDGASWPDWSPIESFQLEQAGEPEAGGIGAIWVFRRGRVIGRDQIVELVPERRFSYRNLSGLPLRDYRGDVDLEPAEGGTRICWHTSFLPQVPGTGWLWRWGIRRFVDQCARGLAAYADQRSTEGRPTAFSTDDPSQC